jgi:ABC-type sugar transport system permease subunit/ABC-type glycerol-3-phosphate transport system substrate-binding protein
MRHCRLVFSLVAAVAALIAVAGSETPAPAVAQKDLVIWGIGIGPDAKGQDAVIREFQKRNPDLRVRLLSMGAGRMDPQKLMTAIVGNAAPDVINQDRFTLSDWASKNAFVPLDDYIARDKDKDPNTPTPDKFYPAPWAEATYLGKVYGIPTSADNRILYYNKSIFREKAAELRAAGLDPERPPRTWSETLAYSKVLTEFNKDGTLKRAGFMPNFGNTWLYLFAFQMNAKFMSDDGRTCTLYSKESETALQFMVDGYKLIGGFENAKKFESGFLGKENDAFVIGKVAMKIDGDWIIDGLAQYGPGLDFGVAEPPVPDDRFYKRGAFVNEKDTFITWMGGFSLGIPRGARNPDGAWRYIKFATSQEGQRIERMAQRDWQRKRGRQFISRQVGNRLANEDGRTVFRPGEAKFGAAIDMHTKMAEFGRIRPPTFVGQLLWNEHVRAIEAACYGKATPADALKEGTKVVQRDLDAFFEKEKYPVIDLGLPAKIAGGVGIALVAGFMFWFSRLKLGRLAKTEAKWAYLFISPWIIGFLVFTLGPMIASLFFSFTMYDVLNEARWVGLKNYNDLFGADSQKIAKALTNVAFLAGIGVPFGIMTGLAVALLLNTATKGMRFYRTLFYLPAIVPGVASAVLWAWVLTADPNKGLINSVWAQTITPWLGEPPPGWLQSADWSKWGLIAMGLWGAGSGMVLWLAGLKGISGTLYEAAGIDGATPRQQFWSVTFPQLSPIIFFNLVMGFIGATQEFDRMYIMNTSGAGSVGPDDSMLTPVFLLFTNGFAYFKMGTASAMAWGIFAIILILTGIQFLLGKKWVHYETSK